MLKRANSSLLLDNLGERSFVRRLGRAMRQLSIGLAVGSLIAIAAFSEAGIGLGRGAVLLVTVAVVITMVAAFAALGPARRSLRLPTVDALRAHG